ncbi:hypothetical protein C0991_008243 [Blastosporella zonata]|nr:hypothetical protein C0991_008243 [Blastosporella zonata]
MSPAHDEDWSDSDDDVGSDVETSVLLGVPDGLVQSDTDISDAAVSRIGGHPVRAISPMYFHRISILIHFRKRPFSLLLNLLSLRPNASVRAWRGLRRNDKYAAKLEIRLAKKRAAEEAKAQARALAEQQKNTVKKNPFSMNASSTPNMFGIGAQIFGETPPPSTQSTEPKSEEVKDDEREDENDDRSDSDDSATDDELLTAVASVTVSESPWKAAPSYPALYLSTVSEYLPPQSKPKLPPGTQVTDPLDDDDRKGGKDKDISWASEAYEDSLEMDHVFERFTKRVGYEGEQCVRYELNGTPLPFSSDKIFASLFPSPPAPTLPVTKAAFTVINTPKRTYFPTGIPACPSCRGKRIFECQLMPNLINVLRRPTNAGKKQTDEERRKAVERALKGAPDEGRGMEWGTSMIFSCEKDCCFDEEGKETRGCWREEIVLIQAAL